METGVLVNNSGSVLRMSTQELSPLEPTRRDTIITYPNAAASYLGSAVSPLANGTIGGYVKLRLNATTPGAWVVHCHLTVRHHAVVQASQMKS